jgi:hypothetical protein
VANGKADHTPRIQSFLEGCFYRGTPIRVELRHQVNGAGSNLIRPWPVGTDGQAFDLPQVARDIAETTWDYAKSLSRGRMQTFMVLCYFKGEDEPQPLPLQVRHEGKFDPNDGFGDSETPDAIGQMGQVLRHNEAYARVNMHYTTRMFEMYDRNQERLERKLEAADDRAVQVFTLMKDFIMANDERAARLRTQARREKIEELAIDKVGSLVSIFASNLLPPGPASGARPAKGSAEMRGLLVWVGKHQTQVMPLLMSAFSGTQQMLMMKFAQMYEQGFLHQTDKPEIIESMLESFLQELSDIQVYQLMGDPEGADERARLGVLGMFPEDDARPLLNSLVRLYTKPAEKKNEETVSVQ